jgi:hypothetical protein
MTPTPRPAPARPSAPALKLYSTVVPVDRITARAFGCQPEARAAVYVVAPNRGQAMDHLDRFASEFYLPGNGRDVEVSPFGGGPEIAQAIARDDRRAMVEGAVFAVHGTTVLAIDEQGFPTTAGRYAHDRKRYIPTSAASRLAEMIEHAERVLRDGHGLTERDEIALREVIDAAMVRQIELREAERQAAAVAAGAAVPACLADAD